MEVVTADRPKPRSYSDADKAKALIALDLNGGNVKYTAQQIDIPRKTLATWKDGNHLNEDVASLRHNKTKDLADKFEELAHLYIGQAKQTIDSAKGTNAITGAAVAVDKMRLLRDQSTSNINVQQSVIHSYITQGLASNIEEAQAIYDQLESGIAEGELD